MGTNVARPRLDCETVVREKRRDKKSAMVQYLAQEFRVKVLDVLHDRGTGHWGGAASAAELLVALYFDAMNIRPGDLKWPDRDRLVVSKGHASCMLYTVLANRGYFPTEELATFRQLDSRLQGHPCMRKTPGVEMSTGSLGHGTGHWGGAASAAELLVALYFDVMNIRPDDLKWPDRDRLVVSKGHASCMLYTVLANRGYFPTEELATFRQLDSRLQGHPCMRKTPGVEMSTGSLGHGTSVALGMALAARLLGRSYWTYVLLGDGDLNEGQTWEAIMAAAKFKPPRLVALIDYNKVQLDGPSDIIMPMDPLPEKLRAFNWNVAPVVYDGHNAAEVLESLDWTKCQTQFPAAVIYRTHKGRGVSFMEDNAHWHGAVVDDQTYAKARNELLETLRKLELAL